MVETSDPILPSNPLPLEYGKSPGRRVTVRRLALLVTFVLLVLAGWKWGPTAYTRSAVYYYQWRCLNYSPPSDLVVYESDPEAAKILLQKPGYSGAEMWVMSGSNGIPPVKRPLIAEYQPGFFNEFLRIANITLVPPSPRPGEPSVRAICFLGELKSPAGKPWLVVVDCIPMGGREMKSGFEWGCIRAYSTIPGTLKQGPASFVSMGTGHSLVNESGRRPHGLKIFAGRRDPADPSRFTIPYQIWNQHSAIDGKIDNEGRVTLTRQLPRPLPSKDPLLIGK